MPTLFDASRVRVTRPWVPRVLGWSAFVLALAPLVIALAAQGLVGWSKPAGWNMVLGLCWGGAAVSAFGAIGAKLAHLVDRKPAQLRVDRNELWVRRRAAGDDYERLPAEIQQATVVPGKGVQLQITGGRQIVVETDDESAQSLLTTLPLGVEQRRLQTAMRPSTWRAPALVGVIVGLHALGMQLADKLKYLTSGEAAFLLVTALISITAVLIATRAPQIEVGADGVTLRRRMRARFLRFEEIASVELSPGELVLRLHDGSVERLSVAKKNRGQLAAAHRRIELGLAAQQSEPLAPARLALLARSGRSAAQWRESLTKLMTGDAGFRRSPLSEDDLRAILASPNATPEQRIGAALALRVAGTGEAATQIRIAAESCAESDTRRTLLRIAEADTEHDAIDEALADDAVIAAGA